MRRFIIALLCAFSLSMVAVSGYAGGSTSILGSEGQGGGDEGDGNTDE
jgi:hypothetical protein